MEPRDEVTVIFEIQKTALRKAADKKTIFEKIYWVWFRNSWKAINDCKTIWIGIKFSLGYFMCRIRHLIYLLSLKLLFYILRSSQKIVFFLLAFFHNIFPQSGFPLTKLQLTPSLVDWIMFTNFFRCNNFLAKRASKY